MFTNKRPPVLNQVLQAEAQNLVQNRWAPISKQTGPCFKIDGRLFYKSGHMFQKGRAPVKGTVMRII